MPELPEVQTVVNHLARVLPGLSIKDVWSDTPQVLKRAGGLVAFRRGVRGRRILKVTRRGKNILLHISGGRVILVHQKMTGHLLYGLWSRLKNRWQSREDGPLRDDPHNRFIRVIFFLSNGRQLALCDMRKFAKILLASGEELARLPDLTALGPDALDRRLTPARFAAVIRGKNGPIKKLLLDQRLLAGVGNIYADESLFAAGLHPGRPGRSLSVVETRRLLLATRKILRAAIRLGGSSDVDFRNPRGEKGRYQDRHLVYRRTGTPCPRGDGGVIKRIVLGGRGTNFCPVHQRSGGVK